MPNPPNREKRSFKDLLSKVPPEVNDDLREGFSLIGQLTSEQLKTLVDIGLATIDEPHSVDDPSIQQRLGLDEKPASAAAVAAMILSMSPVLRESGEEIVGTLRTKLSLDAAQVSGARALIAEFGSRANEVSTADQKRALASALLPSFEHLWWTVDMRLKFTGENVSTFAPVAVAYVRTDAAPPLGRFWFQMSKFELKRLITEAQGALEEMERAERWVAGHVK